MSPPRNLTRRAWRGAGTRLRVGQLQHAERESRPTVRAPRAATRKGNVAGAARQIERALAAGVTDASATRRPLPPRILPERQQCRDQIVAIGDGRKQLSIVTALSVGRVEGAAQGHARILPCEPTADRLDEQPAVQRGDDDRDDPRDGSQPLRVDERAHPPAIAREDARAGSPRTRAGGSAPPGSAPGGGRCCLRRTRRS